MRFSVIIPILLLQSQPSQAGQQNYSCVVNQILELSEDGTMKQHSGIFAQLVGETFFVDRHSGAMKGLPFDTSAYKDVKLLDLGSSENSYKAIVTSHPPNMWVIYIYIAEHQKSLKKPFWGTDDGDKIFSGRCE